MSYPLFALRGGRFSEANPKSDVDWQVHRAKTVPGPGAYGNPLDVLDKQKGGGRFSSAKSKTDVDWAIYRAKTMPGPGQYEPKKDLDTMKGGRFNLSSSKNDIEWKMYHAARLPGPGQYDVTKGNTNVGGGKFSTAKAKSDVDWKIYRAKQTPGPGEYDATKTELPSGGKWGKSNPKSDVEWAMLRASKMPGPTDYAPDWLRPPRMAGGKFSNSNPKSDVEWSIYRASQTPGPGEYSTDLTSISFRTRDTGSPPRRLNSSRDVTPQRSSISQGGSANNSPRRAKTALGLSRSEDDKQRRNSESREQEPVARAHTSMSTTRPMRVKRGRSIAVQTDTGEQEQKTEKDPKSQPTERPKTRHHSVSPPKMQAKTKAVVGDHVYSFPAEGPRRKKGGKFGHSSGGMTGRRQQQRDGDVHMENVFDTEMLDQLLDKTRPNGGAGGGHNQPFVPEDPIAKHFAHDGHTTMPSPYPALFPDVQMTASWWSYEPLFGVPLADKFAAKIARGKKSDAPREPFCLSRSKIGELEMEMTRTALQRNRPSVASIYSSSPWSN